MENTTNGKMFSQEEVNKLIQERIAREKAKYSDLEQTYEELKASVGETDTINDKLKALEEENKGYKKQIEELNINHEIDKAIILAKGKHSDKIKRLLDMDKVKFENGVITGLEEQIKAMKDDEVLKHFFEDKPVMKGARIGESSIEPMDRPAREDLRSVMGLNSSSAYFQS